MLPKWPFWEHLFYHVFYSFRSLRGHASARRVSHKPCFRQAHCFMRGPLRFLPVPPNPTRTHSHIGGFRVRSCRRAALTTSGLEYYEARNDYTNNSETVLLCKRCARSWKVNSQTINVCNWHLHRQYLMKAPELHKRILARKPCVTDVLCDWEIIPKQENVCNHLGPMVRMALASVRHPNFRRHSLLDTFSAYEFGGP